MSATTQRILIWWALVFLTIYGVCLFFLLHMLPPPSPTWNAERIAAFYVENGAQIRWGATITSWTSGFMVPVAIVVAVQLARHEKGRPIWSILSLVGGSLMSIFLVLPPVFWGVAAFTPTRAPEITATIHELALLTLVTTDQYFIFMWVGIVVICLTPNSVIHSPFPRWFGYFTAWIALMFEVGALAFLTRTGPLAWNGLLVFWSPLSLFGLWLIIVAVLLFKAIAAQERDADTVSETRQPVDA
jgi:hypothetical protein